MPLPQTTLAKLTALVDTNKKFIQTAEAQQSVNHILHVIAEYERGTRGNTTVSDIAAHNVDQLSAEVTQEQEQEQEEEQEEVRFVEKHECLVLY